MEDMKRESFAPVNLYVDIEKGNGLTVPTKFRANCWGLSGESEESIMDAIAELNRKFVQQAERYRKIQEDEQ